MRIFGFISYLALMICLILNCPSANGQAEPQYVFGADALFSDVFEEFPRDGSLNHKIATVTIAPVPSQAKFKLFPELAEPGTFEESQTSAPEAKANSSAPQLILPETECVLMDPEKPALFRIKAVNVHVLAVTAYTPEAVFGTAGMLLPAEIQRSSRSQPLLEKRFTFVDKPGVEQLVTLDLTSLREQGHHQVVLGFSLVLPSSSFVFHGGRRLSSGSSSPPESERYQGIGHQIWVQFTNTDLSVVAGNNHHLAAVAVSRSDGKMVSAEKMVAVSNERAVQSVLEQQPDLIYAGQWNEHERCDGVQAKLKQGEVRCHITEMYGTGVDARHFLWWVATDRSRVHPGERVDFFGWVRGLNKGRLTIPVGWKTLDYIVKDSNSVEVARGKVELTKTGAVSGSFNLPADLSTGYATIQFPNTELQDERDKGYCVFSVEGPVAPQDISLRANSLGPWLAGADTTVEAKINDPGKSTAGEPIRWTIAAKYAQIHPPGWPQFSCGHIISPFFISATAGMQVEMVAEATADALGCSTVRLNVPDLKTHEPVVLNVAARRFADRPKPHATALNVLVQPSSVEIGMRTSSKLMDDGKRIVDCDLLLTGLDGQAIAGQPIEVQALRSPVSANAAETAAPLTVQSSTEPVHVRLTIPNSDPVMIVARAQNSARRITQTSMDVPFPVKRLRPAHALELAIRTDKEQYRPGETCTLIINSPFHDSEGFVAVATPNDTVVKRIQAAAKPELYRFAVTPAMAGFTTGLVKLYDRHSAAAPSPACSTAIGSFQIHVNPNSSPAVLTVEQPTIESSGMMKCLVHMHRGDGSAAANADVILWAEEDRLLPDEPSSAQWLFDEFSRLGYAAVGSWSTHALPLLSAGADSVGLRQCNSIPRPRPLLERARDIVTPVVLEPAVSRYRYCSGIIATDEKGEACVSLPRPAAVEILRINMVGCTADGAEFGMDSIRFAERPPKPKMFAIQPDSSVSVATPTVPASQPPRTPERVPSDKMGLLEFEASNLCRQQPLALDNRASRLITLIAARLLNPECGGRDFDKVMSEDKSILADVSWQPRRNSWIEGADRWSFEIESPFVGDHIGHALALAGLYQERKYANTFDSDTTVGLTFDRMTFKNQQCRDALGAYGIYVAANVFKPANSEQKASFDENRRKLLQPILHGRQAASLPTEAVCWLAMSSQLFDPGPETAVEMLAELKRRARNFDTEQNLGCEQLHSSIFQHRAVMLDALLTCVPTDPKIAQLARDLERGFQKGEPDSDSDVAFGCLALAHYYKMTGKQPPVVNTQRWRQPVYPQWNAATIEREYRGPNGGKPLWRDRFGAWHVNRGSIVEAHITFKLGEHQRNLVLTDVLPEGLATSENGLPKGFYLWATRAGKEMSGAKYSTDWPQKTSVDGCFVRGFGSNFDAGSYSFVYQFSALQKGTYSIDPPVLASPYYYSQRTIGRADKLVVD